MALEVTSRLSIDATATEKNQPVAIGGVASTLVHAFRTGPDAYPSGTADGSQDLVWSSSSTVAQGAPVSLDLAGGLTSVLDGSAISFAEVTFVALRNKSTTAAEVIEVFGNANGVAIIEDPTNVVVVPAGGWFVWAAPLAGVAITGGASDVLQLGAQSGTVSYDLLIMGRSA